MNLHKSLQSNHKPRVENGFGMNNSLRSPTIRL